MNLSAADSRLGRPVLVLSNEQDFAADIVIEKIRARGGDVVRWHLNQQGSIGHELAWRPEVPSGGESFSAVWLRQFLPDPSPRETVSQVDDLLVTREQWRAWLTDLAEGGGRWMNPLWASRRAENKLIQLRAARHLGFEVPPTVVTNSRRIALDHMSDVGSCVVKSVASAYFAFSDTSFVFTRSLEEALNLDENDWSAQPVLVQKKVQPRTDIRVLVVGDYVRAAQTRVEETDWRTGSGDARWVEHTMHPDLRELSIKLVSQLGLAYGALDLADDGERTWFLECNQAGEFGFIDRPLGLGVADAIATWLFQ